MPRRYQPKTRPRNGEYLASDPSDRELREYNIARKIDLQYVETRAAMGLSLKHVAWSLDINEKFLEDRPDYHHIAEAWRRGRAKGIAVVASRLIRSIDEGNANAMMFYLRTHAGWNENPSYPRPADMDETGRVIEAVTHEAHGQTPVVVLPPDATSFEEWEQRARATTPAGPAPATTPA